MYYIPLPPFLLSSFFILTFSLHFSILLLLSPPCFLISLFHIIYHLHSSFFSFRYINLFNSPYTLSILSLSFTILYISLFLHLFLQLPHFPYIFPSLSAYFLFSLLSLLQFFILYFSLSSST